MNRIARDTMQWLLLRPTWVGLLALLFVAPGLGTGLAMDDYWFLAQRPEGGATQPSPVWDLYRIWPLPLGDGTMVEQPWDASPEARIHLFRPLTSISLSFDFHLYEVFGRDARWLHLSNLFLRGLNLIAVWLVFRRLLPRVELAGLALMIYAFDDTHAMAVTWICARHLLLGPALFCFAWNCHLKAQCDGWKWGWPLSWLLWAAALLSSESALGLLPLMIFHQGTMRLSRMQAGGFGDHGKVGETTAQPGRSSVSFLRQNLGLVWAWLSKDRALTMWLGIAGLWLLAYISLGYGTKGQDLYISPWNDPFRFAQLAILRVPSLMMSGALWFFPDPLILIENVGWLACSIGFVLSGILVMFFRWAKVRIRDQDRRLSFGCWSAASLCAAFVCASGPPQDRSLTGIGIGIAAGLALALEGPILSWLKVNGGANRTEIRNKGLSAGLHDSRRLSKAALILLVAHLVVSPLLLPLRCWSHQFFGQVQNGPAQTLAYTFDRTFPLRAERPKQPNRRIDLEFSESELSKFGLSERGSVPKQVVFLSSLGPIRGAMNLAMLRGIGYSSPERSVTLISGHSAFVVTRPRPEEICLRADSGVVTSMEHRAIAMRDQSFERGQQFVRNGVQIEIKEVDFANEGLNLGSSLRYGQVREICAKWSSREDLEQAYLVVWSDEGYLRARLSPVGGEEAYPATDPYPYVSVPENVEPE